MSTTGAILIVDDDERFLDAYRSILGSEGYEVATATARATALQQLDAGTWDVVLLDQKLRGAESGIDLVGEVRRRAPGAKPIVVTAYPEPLEIKRAFAAGAWDYLEKGAYFETLLKVKVHNAVESSRERRLASMSTGEREEELRGRWEQLGRERDANRKGALLEEVVALVFKTLPGFAHVDTRRRSETEEIDILVRNESEDPLWAKEGTYFLVECKNWSSRVGAPELREFRTKLEQRFGRARLGFFVALGGFAETFHEENRASRKLDALVVAVGQAGLARLVEGADRPSVLKELHARAVVAANGH